MKYISFETAKEYLDKACEGLGSNGGLMLKIKFDQEPTIDISTGKWKECETVQVTDEWQSARCSVCGKYHTTPYLYYFDHFNYCPNCGAKMEVIM